MDLAVIPFKGATIFTPINFGFLEDVCAEEGSDDEAHDEASEKFHKHSYRDFSVRADLPGMENLPIIS